MGLTSGDSIGMRSWKFNPGDPELPMSFSMELSYNSSKPSVQKMPIHPRCRERDSWNETESNQLQNVSPYDFLQLYTSKFLRTKFGTWRRDILK